MTCLTTMMPDRQWGFAWKWVLFSPIPAVKWQQGGSSASPCKKGNTQAPKLWVREDNSAIFWEIEGKKPPKNRRHKFKQKNNSTRCTKTNQMQLLSGVVKSRWWRESRRSSSQWKRGDPALKGLALLFSGVEQSFAFLQQKFWNVGQISRALSSPVCWKLTRFGSFSGLCVLSPDRFEQKMMLLPVMSSSNKVKTGQEKTRVEQQSWCPSWSSKDFFLWDLQYFFVISAMLFPAQFSTSCALTAHCTWKLLFDKNWQPLSFWKDFFFWKWDFILTCLLNFCWCKRRWKWVLM